MTSRTVACQGPLSSIISQSLLKFMSTELVMISNHFILCRSLLLLLSILPSIGVFFSESLICIRWPKYYWCFSFSFSPSNEYSGLISFMKEEMAIHSSTHAWKIPWTEEPCRLQSMGSQRFPLGLTGLIS